MNARIVRTIFVKELRDAFRDPRALLYLVGLPLVFYPALLLFLEYIAHRVVGDVSEPPYTVLVTNVEESRGLMSTLGDTDDLSVALSTAPGLAVAQGSAAVGVEPLGGFDEAAAAGLAPRVDLYVNESIPGHGAARSRVVEAIRRYERESGASVALSETVLGSRDDLAFMVGLFPYFLVVLILVGAGHMAIDVTAGEKERRTLETLLVTPAERPDVLWGKTLATVAAAMSAGALGMLGFAAAIALAELITGGRAYLLGLPANGYWVMALGSLPSAFFLSALLIALGTFARSSREGQTYAAYLQMPLLLLALGATYVRPETARWPYAIPLLGMNLMQREYLVGEGDPLHATIAVGSTLALGAATTWLSSRLFRRESILFRA